MRTRVPNQKPLPLTELLGIAGDVRRSGADKHLLPAAGMRLREAIACFMKFRRNTRMALMVYLMFLVLLAGTVMLSGGWYHALLSAFCLLGFLGFLLSAFFHQASFYQALGKDRLGSSPLLLLLLGIPLYFWVHFQLERDMRHALSGMFREMGLAQAS